MIITIGNTISSVGKNSSTPAPPVIDPDAQAFITAAGISNSTQQSAINSLVVSLKGYSIWNKLDVIYPFVGGTATTHKFNLKDPRDLDAAFRIQFSGGWTHNANGITGNGTNALANTFFIPSNPEMNLLGVYARTGTAGQTFMSSYVYDDSGEGYFNGPYGIDFKSQAVFLLNSFQVSTGASPYTEGYTVSYVGGSTTTSVKVYRKGIDVNSNHQPNIWKIPEQAPPITIGAQRADYYDLDAVLLYTLYTTYSTSNMAFAYMGYLALTATEAANLNTAIVAFQNTLGRQV
jgi:hypothetical protein